MIDEKKLIEDIHEYFKRHIDNIYCKDADGDKTVILNFNADIHRIVENQPKVGEWISCSERLPEDSRDVILTTRSSVVGVGCFTASDGKWVQWYSGGGILVDVIAWMPLPEPYREE